MPLRLLLADDHETLREGLRALFEQLPDIDVVGCAADGSEAVALTAEIPLDLVVMDISMPSWGLDATRKVRQSAPNTSVLVLSRHRDTAYVREAFAAGASGYVLKQSPFQELTDAIHAVHRGERYVDRRLGDVDLGVPGRGAANRRLSGREADVLRRAALGHSNKDVAGALGISVKTVEVHKANAMRKLGLADRGDLVRYAVRRGWLQDL